MPDQSLPRRRKWTVRAFWEPRDLWLGVYWTRREPDPWNPASLLVYVCLLPCLPILFSRSSPHV